MHARPTLPEPTRASIVRAGGAEDPESLTMLVRALEADEPRLRVLALRATSRRGAMDRSLWRRALADPAAVVRREALVLLSHLELDDALADQVEASLQDGDALVVDAAAFALGEHPAPRHVPALVACAAHPDPRCREAAVAALGVTADEAGLATIIAALEDKAPVRRRAVLALASFEGPRVEAALDRAAEDRDWQVRAAVEALRA